ncbi:MAG: putative polysaccharide transporter permease protein [Chitinophagaceae bacterium]|nr:putative polysaccharide transporter permease protein [Chitinophagaceae bacterium]
MSNQNKEDWDLIIKPRTPLLQFEIKAVWEYRDLLLLMVKRDITTVYKQTILGPLWFVLQPILTTLIFTLIFGEIAGLPTGKIPAVLFYLSGLIIWNYFSETLLSTSKTFTENAAIFGKVYFPRLIMPLAKVVSGLLKFFIQLALFLIVLAYFILFKGLDVSMNGSFLIIPVLLLLMAGLALGAGIVLSALTTKYRDLIFLINFGVQLMMYATPVIIPLSDVPAHYQWLMRINPMTPVIEAFRYVFLGTGTMDASGLVYSFAFTVILLFIGIIIFNKVEKSFIDTV